MRLKEGKLYVINKKAEDAGGCFYNNKAKHFLLKKGDVVLYIGKSSLGYPLFFCKQSTNVVYWFGNLEFLFNYLEEVFEA